MSRTSMAIAVLARVAVLILEFSRIERKDGSNARYQGRLLLTRGMVAVLRVWVAGIRPWLLFTPEESRGDIVHRISEELRKSM